MINPWMIIGVFVALGSFYGYGHHKGWNDRDADMQLEIAKKNEEARTTENKLNAQISESTSKLNEANNAINQKQTALDRAIRAGRVRLQTTSCLPTTESSTVATGDRDKERSEPNRQVYETTETERSTLAAISEIIAQGDRNTEQLNACLDAYQKVMESINGTR